MGSQVKEELSKDTNNTKITNQDAFKQDSFFQCNENSPAASNSKTNSISTFISNDTRSKRYLSCDDCDYKTNVHTNLKHHINAKHKNVKDFQCSHCQNTYSQ